MGADAVTVHDLIEKLSKALLSEFKIISREEYRRIMHNARQREYYYRKKAKEEKQNADIGADTLDLFE